MGLAGVAVILLLAVLFSANRRAINLRIVLSALALDAALAVFVLRTPIGQQVIDALSGGVNAILAYSQAGIAMVFGRLATDTQFAVIFAVHVLPIVIFFSALMAVLYHLRIMQMVVAGLGVALQAIIGTKPVESLNAAANVFLGQTEAPLVVRPYLERLTGPQLFAIMVSGLASVAGTVLAAYVQIGADAKYLLAASFMSAPGGLLMAKLMMPDDKGGAEPELKVSSILAERSPNANVIMAAAVGAQDGLRLALNIGAMLIAFVGLIALFNGLVGGLGGLAGVPGLSLQGILGWVFAPLMFLVGVPWAEAQTAGAVFGQKLILNEFVAFIELARLEAELSPRTVAMLTFALCGFANFSSIAILLGGLGSLIPQRLSELARFGLRAVAAGSLSNLLSAALAGLVLSL